jgi:hypothetical protein
LIAILHANGPATDRAEALAVYGRFIGDWDAAIVTYTPDGVRHHGQGEIHFDWILEGRAIQDVWMILQQKDRVPHAPEMPVAGNWYGTTIRRLVASREPTSCKRAPRKRGRCRAGA